MRTWQAPLLCVALLFACAGDDPEGVGPGGEGDDPAEAFGRFELTTTLDATSALPEAADNSIELLLQLSEAPGATLFELLDQADIPIVDNLLGAIPSALRDSVIGWVDDFLLDQLYEGVPLAETIQTWARNLHDGLSDIDLITVLDTARINPDGSSNAIHSLSAVDFSWGGELTHVDTPDIVDQLTLARDLAIVVDAPAGIITIGDHGFHMPLGDYAVVGFNMALESWTGHSSLEAALSDAFRCEALAASVSSKCIGPVCVGHEQDLLAVCEQGVSLVAAQIEEQIASIEYAELQLNRGEAILLLDSKSDDVADGHFDQMEAGTWDAVADVNGGAVAVDASFVGRRLE